MKRQNRRKASNVGHPCECSIRAVRGAIIAARRKQKLFRQVWGRCRIGTVGVLLLFDNRNRHGAARRHEGGTMENCCQRLPLAVIVLLGAAFAAVTPAAAQTFTEYPIPLSDTRTNTSDPTSIITGPDGALWFSESNAIYANNNKVGRITTPGVFTAFSQTLNVCPCTFTVGPDNAVWIGENGVSEGQIGRLTTQGTYTTYQLPYGNGIGGIATGSDGGLWFTTHFGENIQRISTTGTFSQLYNIPTANGSAGYITSGPDGDLWFTEYSGNNIGKMTIGGVFTEYPLPNANSFPTQITTGPDGALWFTETFAPGRIGRITTSGSITEFSLPTGSYPQGITSGPDGALWFADYSANKIGRITTSGVITEFPIPTALGEPYGITTGPDGALWFTEESANNIGRLAATFTASATSGSAPLAVTFHANFGGTVNTNSFSVNFGDASTGTLQLYPLGIMCPNGNPSCNEAGYNTSHTYASAGTYTATLLNSNNTILGSATITVASPSTVYNPIYPSGGTAPVKTTTFESQTTPAMQDVPGQTLEVVPPMGSTSTFEVPFTVGNAAVPAISSFTASPASLSPFDAGESATLSWSVASATSLSISGLGAVIGNSIQVSPSQTTTYTLTASNAQGSVTAQTTVTIAGYRLRRADPLSR